MKKKEKREDFKKLLDEKHITKLYHFTDRDNLESIITTWRPVFMG